MGCQQCARGLSEVACQQENVLESSDGADVRGANDSGAARSWCAVRELVSSCERREEMVCGGASGTVQQVYVHDYDYGYDCELYDQDFFLSRVWDEGAVGPWARRTD